MTARPKPPPVKSSRPSPRAVAAATIAALAVMIALTAGFRVVRQLVMRGADGFYYPFMRTAAKPGKVVDPALLKLGTRELAARVEKLAADNRELALQSNAAAALREENRLLRQLLELSDRPEMRFEVAEIVMRDPLRFRETFTIGKGTRSGIVPGAAVVEVTPDGRLLMVGVVAECGARTAKVVTLADPSLHLSGRVGSNGAIGFINTGSGAPEPGAIRFGMLPVRSDYISGGAVVTTGYETAIPAGIKIGELDLSGGVPSPGLNHPDRSCDLIPSVRFDTLRFVAVLKLAERP